jgi:putative transposase
MIMHSDQSSRFGIHDGQSLLNSHNLIPRMRRRNNRHDNAVAESFCQLLKWERIRQRIDANRVETRRNASCCVEMLYDP